MGYSCLYPKPKDETLSKFEKKLGYKRYKSAPNLMVAEYPIIAININPVTVSEYKGAEDVMIGLKKVRYLFTANIRIKKLKSYKYLKIGKNIYDTKLVAMAARLVRTNRKKKIDFWQLTNEKTNDLLLGLGSDNGFIIMTPVEDEVLDSVELEEVTYNIEHRTNDISEEELKIDLKTVEKWIEELKIR